MKKLLIVVMACYGLSAGAQVRQSENFIYLYSDSVIYARNIKLRPDFFNSLQLRADSRRIPLEQVKFFNNENGFFANIRKLNFGRTTEFAERIVDGKINIFQLRSFDPLLDDRGYPERRRREAISIEMYYNKGYADLKKVNYNNLKADMAGNAQTMELLEGYRRSIRTSKTLYITAGASLVGSLVSFLVAGNTNKADLSFNNKGFGTQNTKSSIKNPNFAASFALLGIGTGLAIGGYTTSVSGMRRLEQAVDIYNK